MSHTGHSTCGNHRIFIHGSVFADGPLNRPTIIHTYSVKHLYSPILSIIRNIGSLPNSTNSSELIILNFSTELIRVFKELQTIMLELDEQVKEDRATLLKELGIE